MSAVLSSTWSWAAGFAAGYLLGVAYFSQLRSWSHLLARASSPYRLMVTASMRVFIAVTVFVLLMLWSAPAAICGLIGFSLARRFAVSRTEIG
ncbi:MAG: ATP synthase subunit I [Hyphomicrobiaceae bacterium]